MSVFGFSSFLVLRILKLNKNLGKGTENLARTLESGPSLGFWLASPLSTQSPHRKDQMGGSEAEWVVLCCSAITTSMPSLPGSHREVLAEAALLLPHKTKEKVNLWQ